MILIRHKLKGMDLGVDCIEHKVKQMNVVKIKEEKTKNAKEKKPTLDIEMENFVRPRRQHAHRPFLDWAEMEDLSKGKALELLEDEYEDDDDDEDETDEN
jgi:hypothetical protein